MDFVPSEFKSDWYHLSSDGNRIGMREVDSICERAEEVLRDRARKRYFERRSCAWGDYLARWLDPRYLMCKMLTAKVRWGYTD